MWNFKEGAEKTVFCFTNCEQVELIQNGQRIHTERKTGPEPMEIPVLYHDGELTAIGYIGGRAVCRHTLRTAGKAVRVQASADCANTAAGGYAQICAEIQDEDGNRVMTRREVCFRAAGGQIIRCANGSLAGEESYCTDHTVTHNGRAIAILTAEPGETVTVTVTSPGLEPCEVILNA